MDYRRKIIFGRLPDQTEAPQPPKVSQQLRARLNTLLENETEAPKSENLPEVAPLSVYCGYHEDDPPEGLARRTCDRIWALVDDGKLQPVSGGIEIDQAASLNTVTVALGIADTSDSTIVHCEENTQDASKEAGKSAHLVASLNAVADPVATSGMDETVDDHAGIVSLPSTSLLAMGSPKSFQKNRLRKRIRVFAEENSRKTAVLESTAELVSFSTTTATESDKNEITKTGPADESITNNETQKPLPLKEVIRNILTEDGAAVPDFAHTSTTTAAATKTFSSQEAAIPKSTQRRTVDILASLAVGFLVALISYPLLHYAKDRVVAVVFQEVVRDMTKGTNYINELQNKVTAAETKESYAGFDPQKATWHLVTPASPVILGQAPVEPAPLLSERSFATVLPVSSNFSAVSFQNTEAFSPPIRQVGFQGLLVHDNNTVDLTWSDASDISSEIPGFATTMTAPPTFVAESPVLSEIHSSAIPQQWIDLLYGENSHLVACPGQPEIIRGQNLSIDGNRAFFRHYPVQQRDITAEYHRPQRNPRPHRIRALIPVQAVGHAPPMP